eukprot:CCRYP_007209-RB/>CCRYP_007209-RB protein AED:0.25 eAED:0.23 QI:0/-1/0/1/-1/1/1/0/629
MPQYALASVSSWAQPPARVLNVGSRHGPVYSSIKVRHDHLHQLSLLQDDWSDVGVTITSGLSSEFASYFSPNLADDPAALTVEALHPCALKAKAAKSDADNPTWSQAMNSPDSDKWFEAMEEELTTLEHDLAAWDLVPREPWMHVLPSTWAFHIKRFPNGLVKKFKARFCVRGDCQKEGIDFWETWPPVVQWSTVRLMMTLAAKLDLCSAQADITAAFVHADLEPGEQIFVRQPAGFQRDGDHVLSLKRTVYGLRQAPRSFFRYLSRSLTLHGLVQSDLDPCLFIGKHIIVVVYIDDLLFYSKSMDTIDSLISALHDEGIWIRKEGSAEGFLGVDVTRDTSSRRITLTQTGLTQRIVEALGLCSHSFTALSTPPESAPLPKDSEGDLASGAFNYAAVVGMLLYLSGHSRPDIAFAVHQCARYTFRPTRKHELALIRIGRYLKGTMDKGLILSPSDEARIDCFPDADFAGLYGHEDSQDPHCARSRTGFVILAFGCPVLWKSRLQTEIALSTMEAEYVALSTACKDLFPIVDMAKSFCLAIGLSCESVAQLHIKIHEDNVGALTLAGLEPRRMTPRSKHYAIKYHWFCEHVAARRVQLVKVETHNQLGDLFTKGLPFPAFSHLRSMLMGW